MTDVTFSGPGNKFHRSSARQLKSTCCDDSVDQPNAAICIQPAAPGSIGGSYGPTCFNCFQRNYLSAYSIFHNMDQSDDDAKDGIHFVATQTVGTTLYETVYWFKTYRDMIFDPAPVEKTETTCEWQYARFVSWNRTQDSAAIDPRDIFTFSDFIPIKDLITRNEWDRVFYARLTDNFTAFYPYGIDVWSEPLVRFWQRATGTFGREVTYNGFLIAPFPEVILPNYRREIKVLRNDMSATCGEPPTFIVTGPTGVTVESPGGV